MLHCITGFVGKSPAGQGGGVNYLCLPEDPEWPDGAHHGHQSESYITGTEYQSDYSPVMPQSLENNDVPCAVCEARGKSIKLMIPARKTCPSVWTQEYNGILMSQRHTFQGSDFVCVDGAMQVIAGGADGKGESYLYVVEVRCGSLPCTLYKDGYEMSCVVCTK